MKKISLHNMKVFAYHGCLPEEAVIGTDYLISIDVDFDFHSAAETDNLNETVDYVTLAKIAREEMAIRAKLIENVALRIHRRIKKEYPASQLITVKLIKVNPPAGCELESVSVTISE